MRSNFLALTLLTTATILRAESPSTAPSADSAKSSDSLRYVTTASQALWMRIPELTVDNTSLSKVLDFLRETSGANIVVNWRTLEAAGITRDTPISLSVRDLTLSKMLRLSLDQASPGTLLVYSVDSNVIEITTQEEADKKMITKVYVIDDLIMVQSNNFNPPPLGLGQITQSSGGGGSSLFTNSATSATDPNDTPEKRGNDIASLIKSLIRPNIWKDNGGTASIQFFSGKLIVTAPVSVQEAIGGPVSNKDLHGGI